MVNKFLIIMFAVLVGCGFCSRNWKIIPGSLKHVSVSINYLAGVNKNDEIFICEQPCTGSLKQLAGRLMQLDVNDIEIWGVNSAHDIFKRPADGSGSWTHIGGKLKHVSASGNGYIWGVNSNDDIFVCKKPCTGSWKNIPGKLMQIDGGDKYVFGVNSDNAVYRRAVNGDGDGDWKQISGKAMKYVTVGCDAVFGVGTDSGTLYHCSLPCDDGEWTKVDDNSCFDLDQVEVATNSLAGTSSGIILERPR